MKQLVMTDFLNPYETITDRLESASPSLELDDELIQMILALYDEESADTTFDKFQKFSLRDILGYLQASHKYYLTKKLPEIEQSIVQIFTRYGQSHELLSDLVLFFNAYKSHLIEHIRMEEKVFFPYVKKLLKAAEGRCNSDELAELANNEEVKAFNDAHDPVEDELKEVTEILKQHTAGQELPLPYRVFMNQVAVFELDLRKHALIEDHVMIPMVKELERNVFSR